jgi:hypothetical protein
MTITLTIERPSCTIELQADVEFEYHRAHRGERDSCGGVRGAGPALEPDEPAELEFIRATVDGNEIELHDEEIEQAEELAWEQKADQ